MLPSVRSEIFWWALIHTIKEFKITFTNFPHSLIGIFSVATLVFSKPWPPTNLLLHVKQVFSAFVIGTCKLKSALWVHGSLVPYVHGPPHSSKGEFPCRPLAHYILDNNGSKVFACS